MRDWPAHLRALRSFRGAPPAARAFLLARSANLPLGDLDEPLRGLHGRVLSLGCGHGLAERYLAEVNPAVAHVDGLELDEARVAAAAQAPHPRVTVRAQDVRDLDVAGSDAALALDVLHHVPHDDHGALATALAAALRPGGTLVVKDIATRPAWKHRVNAAHDRLVAGERTRGRDPRELAELLLDEGFEEAVFGPIARRSPYPHFLLVARRA